MAQTAIKELPCRQIEGPSMVVKIITGESGAIGMHRFCQYPHQLNIFLLLYLATQQ